VILPLLTNGMAECLQAEERNKQQHYGIPSREQE
jgi:hypothetical protein